MPDMHYVDSSNVEAIGYCPETEELHVQFLKSGLYVYAGVPEWVYVEFMEAESKGRYLNENIKECYPYERR